jgi:hypothetical protein
MIVNNYKSDETKNDTYTYVEPNFYTFEKMNNLETNMDDILKNNNFSHAYLLCYSINNTGYKPFVQYILHKDSYGDILSLPSFYIKDYKNIDTERLVSFIHCYLYMLFKEINIEKENEYKGYYVYNGNLYIFFDFTKCNLLLNDIYKMNNIWFVLGTELIMREQPYICGMEFSENIINFFNIRNLDFIILKDSSNNNYELPYVYYVGKEESLLNFTFVFGESKNQDGILGPYYYFTNFNNAIKQGSWNKSKKEEFKYGKVIADKNGKYIKGGIVRFAVFKGNCLVKLNNPNDIIDESEIKLIKLNDETTNKFEQLTMRISDYDGKWTDMYDSVQIGIIELDNGEKLKETPILVVKNYEQQVPLSYHYIDKKLLGNTYADDKDYMIM